MWSNQYNYTLRYCFGCLCLLSCSWFFKNLATIVKQAVIFCDWNKNQSNFSKSTIWSLQDKSRVVNCFACHKILFQLSLYWKYGYNFCAHFIDHFYIIWQTTWTLEERILIKLYILVTAMWYILLACIEIWCKKSTWAKFVPKFAQSCTMFILASQCGD